MQQREEKLTHIEYLQVIDTQSNHTFCGSDQEWFFTERQRLTGCGPSAAANILFYIERKDNLSCCHKTKNALLSFMEDTWLSVTPRKNGIPSVSLFQKKLTQYANKHGKDFLYSTLNIPADKTKRPNLNEVITFISHGLQADVPIAFLNLDSGAEQSLESWHWVTIVALYYSDDNQIAKVSICDEGMTKQIDLKLWIETTTQGGSFIYFLPDHSKNGGLT